MKTLRLLVTKNCNRTCPGCCNNDWDLDSLPVITDYENYDVICLTGGEPLRYNTILGLVSLIKLIKSINPNCLLVVYTANVRFIQTILQYADGVTLTLHDQSDLINLNSEKPFIDRPIFADKSFRLNIFEEVLLIEKNDVYPPLIGHWDVPQFYNTNWEIKTGMNWIKNCPLPSNETFGRISTLL